jgi:SARP family transcriptional regulator, regulator of embCAB operon
LAETRIQLCGAFVARIEGRRIERELPGRQGRLLFAYLAANRLRSVSRAELVDTLWLEDLPAAPDAALRALLSKLRRFVPIEGRTEVRLALSEPAWVDVEAAARAIHRAESAIAQGEWAEAWAPSQVALFVSEREFLVGEEGPWIEEERRSLRELHVRALEAHGASCFGVGGTELPAAERVARRLVQQEPFREAGHRLLMESLAATGNPAAALRVYEDLRVRLREELGVAPSDATQELHRRLLGG